MPFSQFHFEQNAWLWGLLAIPAMLLLHALYLRAATGRLLERFADRHLLPHLMKSRGNARRPLPRSLFLWSIAWLCGAVAMAGPRWNYTDEQTFRPAQDLVIVLDLSQSMNIQDVKPSRIARALEEIEDLLDMSRGTSIGLVAYAAVPHMVTPLTDDVRTIRNLLPALNTSLVVLQGDRLEAALKMAASMLKAELGGNKSILVISDGGFEDENFAALAHAAGNARIYTMGVGTATGAPVPGNDGGARKGAVGKTSISRLQAGRLQSLAAAGHGFYVEANYTDSDTRAILASVEAANNQAQVAPKSVRVWEDRFYIPALLLALLLLPLFRRGAVFPVVILLVTAVFPAGQAHATSVADLFLNRDQQAQAAYRRGDYKDAMAKFDTLYRRGVVAYRAGAYDKAAALFKVAAGQKDGLDALYNLGNAQLMQNQPEDAIASYKAVLKQRPDDASAWHNLAIAEKMLARSKPPPDNQQKDQNKQQKNGGQNKSQSQQQGKNNAQNQPPASNKSGSQNQRKAGQSKGDPKAGQQQNRPSQGQAPPQQARQQQTQPKAARRENGQAGPVGGTSRTQRDVKADEWLGRIDADPGSFLKNQFMIEDHEAASRQKATQ